MLFTTAEVSPGACGGDEFRLEDTEPSEWLVISSDKASTFSLPPLSVIALSGFETVTVEELEPTP